MSTSLRDQRVRLYTYGDTGSDGLPSSGYTMREERWGRFTPGGARERLLAAQQQVELDGVVTLAYDVYVSGDDILAIGTDLFKVTGFVRSREVRETLVFVQFLSDELYKNLAESILVSQVTGVTVGVLP